MGGIHAADVGAFSGGLRESTDRFSAAGHHRHARNRCRTSIRRRCDSGIGERMPMGLAPAPLRRQHIRGRLGKCIFIVILSESEGSPRSGLPGSPLRGDPSPSAQDDRVRIAPPTSARDDRARMKTRFLRRTRCRTAGDAGGACAFRPWRSPLLGGARRTRRSSRGRTAFRALPR